MASNPAVIPDDDRLGIFDVLSTALHFGLVRSCENGYIWTYHDTVATGKECVSGSRSHMSLYKQISYIVTKPQSRIVKLNPA